MNKDQAFEKWAKNNHDFTELQFSSARSAWDIQQAKIDKLTEALKRIEGNEYDGFQEARIIAKEALSSVEK